MIRRTERRGFLGCFIILLIIILLPFIITAIATSLYNENAKEQAKVFHVCNGIVEKVESGEDPDYTAWKADKSKKGMKLYLGNTQQTVVKFKDGRVKKFAGVPDFEIPIDTSVNITYDGNGEVTKVESLWPKNPFIKD